MKKFYAGVNLLPRVELLVVLASYVLILCALFIVNAHADSTIVPGSSAIGNTLFVAINGSDTSGMRGRPDRPFKNPKAAVTAAQAGDMVIVYPGLYTNQNALGKNGVNFFTYPGATISYIEQTTNGLGRGFFDDRDGVLTNIVAGYGTWKYSCGTNPANIELDGFTYVDNTNTKGAVVLTNFASSLKWQSGDCYFGDVGIGGNLVFFYILNTVNNVIEVNDMYDMYFPSILLDIPGIGPFAYPSKANGLFWNSGESHFTFNHLHPFGGGNPFWWDGASTSYTNYEGEAWITGNLSECKIYLSGTTPTWRVWATVTEVRLATGTSPIAAWSISGPGKYYIMGNQKSENSIGGPTLSMGSTTNKEDMIVYVNSEAFKSSQQWVFVGSGTLYANILAFEDTGANGGTVDEGIKVFAPNSLNSNAFANVTGLTMTANNGRPISIGGGTNVFTGLTIRSTNNTCVYATNGYSLFNGCLMISKATSNSVDSGTIAVNVGLIGGMQNHAKGANVTIQPGTAVVDANLK